jgi:hypothetical protein
LRGDSRLDFIDARLDTCQPALGAGIFTFSAVLLLPGPQTNQFLFATDAIGEMAFDACVFLSIECAVDEPGQQLAGLHVLRVVVAVQPHGVSSRISQSSGGRQLTAKPRAREIVAFLPCAVKPQA